MEKIMNTKNINLILILIIISLVIFPTLFYVKKEPVPSYRFFFMLSFLPYFNI